eukprot:PhF_6_TR22380/c0_g1_i2/m.31744
MSDIDALINELDSIGGHPKLGTPQPPKKQLSDWDDDSTPGTTSSTAAGNGANGNATGHKPSLTPQLHTSHHVAHPAPHSATVPPTGKFSDFDDDVPAKPPSSTSDKGKKSSDFDSNEDDTHTHTKTPFLTTEVQKVLMTRPHTPPRPSNLGHRCIAPVVGPSTCTQRCPFMICLQCDNVVKRFDHLFFDEDTSYLFLRNSYPDDARLARQLRVNTNRNVTAFVCQCTYFNADELTPLTRSSTMQWSCLGHPS